MNPNRSMFFLIYNLVFLMCITTPVMGVSTYGALNIRFEMNDTIYDIRAMPPFYGASVNKSTTLRGPVFLPSDRTGCSQMPALDTGSIVVVIRGGCSFVIKSLNVQLAGGALCIIGNCQKCGGLYADDILLMGGDLTKAKLLSIATLGISSSAFDKVQMMLLNTALNVGTTLYGSVNGTGPIRADQYEIIRSLFIQPDKWFPRNGPDPCLNYDSHRYSMWCEDGYIVWMDITTQQDLVPIIPDTFSNLNRLTWFRVHDQLIDHLPESLSTMTSMLDLQLNYIRGKSTPPRVPINLESLRLEYMLWDNFPSNIEDLTKLRIVMFPAYPCTRMFNPSRMSMLEQLIGPSSGVAGELPLFNGNHPALRFVNMHTCNFTSVEVDAFDGYTQLDSVLISSNSINSRLPNFRNCSSLQHIRFAKNSFRGFTPLSWNTELNELVSLDLSYNKIESPIALLRLHKLRYIRLAHNRLTCVSEWNGELAPSAVGKFVGEISQSANVIDLGHNQLRGGWGKILYISPSTNIEELYLNNNELTSVQFYEFANIPSLLTLDLSNNFITSRLPDTISLGQWNIRLLDMRNNSVRYANIPSWLSKGSELTEDRSGAFLCPTLNADPSWVRIDFVYDGYADCVCSNGFYGIPPACLRIPDAITIDTNTTDRPPPPPPKQLRGGVG
jgi:Leucine-rich repeat (LRR) protein